SYQWEIESICPMIYEEAKGWALELEEIDVESKEIIGLNVDKADDNDLDGGYKALNDIINEYSSNSENQKCGINENCQNKPNK
ncbi:6328_t:CDS:2, partial [Dentiscutata erythropus]